MGSGPLGFLANPQLSTNFYMLLPTTYSHQHDELSKILY